MPKRGGFPKPGNPRKALKLATQQHNPGFDERRAGPDCVVRTRQALSPAAAGFRPAAEALIYGGWTRMLAFVEVFV